MAYHDVPFPPEAKALSAKSQWRTIVTETGSGGESRTAVWADARRVYQLNTAVMTLTDYNALEKHFNGRRGRMHSFPLLDRFNSTASAEGFGTGDSSTTQFQLTINVGDSTNAYNREIYKPKNGTISIFKNAVLQTVTTHYTINYSTGMVTFTSAPASGNVLTWSGTFYVPVRYDSDELDPNLFMWNSNQQLIQGPEVYLVETRDIA